MDKLLKNPSFRNFTMLSRKMHALFLQYISDGRIRAPPEADLRFLISTFQYGARTDRRALQSKFKSWAKRMVVENHKLKLISTGKEIIPIEASCKIVMRMHFQGHLSVDQVIEQIREKYTWTKKNFGMDSKMIMNFISKNCNNLDCIRAIENRDGVGNYQCDDFIKDVIISSESRIHNLKNQIQQSCALMTTSPAFSCWPIGHPLSTSLCDIDNSFQSSLRITNVRSMNPVSDISAKAILSKETPKNTGIDLQDTTNNSSDTEFSGKNTGSKSERPLHLVPRSFRKPKNIIDFKALLRAAEQFTDYPTVLYNPKTKFLGSFGLAPKRICSKRTLSKVEKDKKRKKVQDIQNMRYHQNRKNLRDRNKLNKIKLKEQLEKRAYLDKFERTSVDGSRKMISKGFSGTMQKSSNSFKSSSEESNTIISSADDSEIEIVKVVSKIEEPEVIEIVSSSDDENNCKYPTSKNKDVSGDKTMLMNGNIRKTLTKNNFQGTEPLNDPHVIKVGTLKLNQPDKKTFNSVGFTNNCIHPETKSKYFPIFKKPYLLPSNSKGEVAVLPTSQVLSHQNKPVISKNSQATKTVKLHKAFMQGKKPILQPLSSIAKVKSFNMVKLPNSGITNKIPHGTNVFLVQKQPSGLIKMVPCNRVLATKNAIAQCPKETPKKSRPASIMNSVNHVGAPTATKYRSIRPAPEGVLKLNRQKDLDANKLFLNEEMTKLSKWIEGMKSAMARTYFQLNVQRSKQSLESQLNGAIALVKNIRRKLWEIEKLEEQVNGNNLSKEIKNM